MEMYEVMKGEDWSLLSHHYWQSSWSQRLWDARKHHQYIGGSGAEGSSVSGFPSCRGRRFLTFRCSQS